AVGVGDVAGAEGVLGFRYKLDLRPLLGCSSLRNEKKCAVFFFERKVCPQILPEKGEYRTKISFAKTKDFASFAADARLLIEGGLVSLEVHEETERSLNGFLPETVEFIPSIR
ncbi:MAG: hypothetical protein MJ183_04955, partial [Treponemataceae bacterium]|nr:hypothetical protein [Treponemataceae bacterium]